MTQRPRDRWKALALGLGLLAAPLALSGCLGASDDREGSGLAAGTGGDVPNNGRGVMTQTQANRQDTGEPTDPSTRPRGDDPDMTKTGGLGTGAHAIPGKPEPSNKAEPEPPR